MSNVTDQRVRIDLPYGVSMDIVQEGFARAQRLLAGLKSGSAAKKAVGRAMARSVNSGMTEAKRAVLAEYNISGATFAAYTQNVNHFSGDTVVFGFRGQSIPLIRFGKQNLGGPVSVSVKNGGGGADLGRAFYQTMSGHLGIYERISAPRYPVRELYGPATPQMMANAGIESSIQAKIVETFDKRIDHEIAAILNGY